MLPCRPPELLRLLVLSPGQKGVTLQTEDNQAFEMLSTGSVYTPLPLLNSLLADTQKPTQCPLGQAHLLPQHLTGSPKGVLRLLPIGG